VMVGYGMAALLFRAFWPESRPSLAMGVAAVGLYLWLGMAMSGPVLFLRRRSSVAADPPPEPGRPPPAAHALSWAELAWSLIGAYWIIVGLVSIPARLHEFKVGDMLWFGLVPIVMALGLRFFGTDRARDRESKLAWTHGAAVILVATWPIAWMCLIVLGKTMR
jgi:hypothetical protein